MFFHRNPVVLVVLVVLPLVGCSFVGVRGLPSDPSQRTAKATRECLQGYWYPILDTANAGIGAYNTGLAASANEGDRIKAYGYLEMDRKAGLALGITQLTLFGAGAVYGFVQLARCEALDNERKSRRRPSEDPTRRAPTAPKELAPGSEDTNADDEPAPAPPPEQEWRPHDPSGGY